jgi:peptidoglycan/LPS O-acetylase OafA/YrhL
MNRLASLDGLRGLAVLMVLFSHLSNAGLHVAPFLHLQGIGRYGVFLFFALSSFLLSVQFFSKPAGDLVHPRLWLCYFVRRLLRIAPLFSLIVVLSTLLTTRYGADFVVSLNWIEARRHLLLMAGKSIFWTVPVECRYYLLLPLLVLLSVLFARKTSMGIVFFLLLLLLAAIEWPASTSVINGIALGPYLPVFLSGTLAAFVYVRFLPYQETVSMPWKYLFEITAVLCLVAVGCTVPQYWAYLAGKAVHFDHFHRAYLLYGPVWSLFIVSHLSGTGHVRYFLELMPLRFIGFISFSIYLWHFPIILYVKRYMPTLSAGEQILLILVLTFCIATLSWFFVERQFLRLFVP